LYAGAVEVSDAAADAANVNRIYNWSFIAGLSSSYDKHNSTSCTVAVPVATVTSLNLPRACPVPTSRPCTAVCGGRLTSRGLTTRIIRLDLTSSHAPRQHYQQQQHYHYHHRHHQQQQQCLVRQDSVSVIETVSGVIKCPFTRDGTGKNLQQNVQMFISES